MQWFRRGRGRYELAVPEGDYEVVRDGDSAGLWYPWWYPSGSTTRIALGSGHKTAREAQAVCLQHYRAQPSIGV